MPSGLGQGSRYPTPYAVREVVVTACAVLGGSAGDTVWVALLLVSSVLGIVSVA